MPSLITLRRLGAQVKRELRTRQWIKYGYMRYHMNRMIFDFVITSMYLYLWQTFHFHVWYQGMILIFFVSFHINRYKNKTKVLCGWLCLTEVIFGLKKRLFPDFSISTNYSIWLIWRTTFYILCTCKIYRNNKNIYCI